MEQGPRGEGGPHRISRGLHSRRVGEGGLCLPAAGRGQPTALHSRRARSSRSVTGSVGPLQSLGLRRLCLGEGLRYALPPLRCGSLAHAPAQRSPERQRSLLTLPAPSTGQPRPLPGACGDGVDFGAHGPRPWVAAGVPRPLHEGACFPVRGGSGPRAAAPPCLCRSPGRSR